MTRPLASGSGLPNTDPFPEQAKETARYRGMKDDALIIGYRQETNTAGVHDYTYDWSAAPIRGRIDPLGAVGGSGRLSGDQIDATSTHTATFDRDVPISSQDRIMDVETGDMYTVNARRKHSDEDVTQVEVRQVTA